MDQTTEIFRALSVDVRRDLLTAMIAKDQTVTDLTKCVSVSQSAVSQHLAVLKDAGLVRDKKVGRNRYYGVRIDKLLLLDEWLEPFRDNWTMHMDAFERQLEKRKN